MVGDRQDGFQPPWLARGKFQSFKCLWARDFVHEMPININECHPVRLIGLFMHYMALPKLIV
jgi:hypothetical protein